MYLILIMKYFSKNNFNLVTKLLQQGTKYNRENIDYIILS